MNWEFNWGELSPELVVAGLILAAFLVTVKYLASDDEDDKDCNNSK